MRPLTFTQYRSDRSGSASSPRLGHLRLQALTGGHLNALYRELEQAGLSVGDAAADARRAAPGAARRRALGTARPQPGRHGRSARGPSARGRRRGRRRSSAASSSMFAATAVPALAPGGHDGHAPRRARRAHLALPRPRRRPPLPSSSSSFPRAAAVTFGPPKSARSRRTIALDAETVGALREHREAQLLERAFAGDAYVDADLVFADELGGSIHPQRLTEWFGRAAQGSRPPHRNAAHSPAHRGDARAHRGRSCSHRRRPAGRRPEHRALDVRAPAAAVRRVGGRAGGGAARRLASVSKRGRKPAWLCGFG